MHLFCETCDDDYDCELDRMDADDCTDLVWLPCPGCGWTPDADDIEVALDSAAESYAADQAADWLP